MNVKKQNSISPAFQNEVNRVFLNMSLAGWVAFAQETQIPIGEAIRKWKERTGDVRADSTLFGIVNGLVRAIPKTI